LIPLHQQHYFLQSIGNLEFLQPSSPSRATRALIDSISEITNLSLLCWQRSFSCTILRSAVKALDYTDETTLSRLSDVCDILKRSLSETSGMKEYTFYSFT